MPCYRPLQAFQTSGGDIVFNELRRHRTMRALDLACGQCIGCRLERSRQWAVRCVHEAQLHENNSFITLTYGPGHLEAARSLCYRDFQLFMKKLRRSTPEKIRFYMCGEYGEKNKRAHFHALLFGHDFNDKTEIKSAYQGKKLQQSHSFALPTLQATPPPLYRSEKLTELWANGRAVIGAVTFESAAYVSRYIAKKMTGDAADRHYTELDLDTGEINTRTPEFSHMSLRPGIGKNWFDKFTTDAYPEGQIVVRGKQATTPKYYDKLFKKLDPAEFSEMQTNREYRKELNRQDNTQERLAVKQKVAAARLTTLKRTL